MLLTGSNDVCLQIQTNGRNSFHRRKNFKSLKLFLLQDSLTHLQRGGLVHGGRLWIFESPFFEIRSFNYRNVLKSIDNPPPLSEDNLLGIFYTKIEKKIKAFKHFEDTTSKKITECFLKLPTFPFYSAVFNVAFRFSQFFSSNTHSLKV
jgi:hypothetical protein